MTEVYGFGSQDDISRISASVRKTESRFISNGIQGGDDFQQLFVEVTELVEDSGGKEVKAIQRVYDGPTRSYIAPPNPFVFDKDNTTAYGQDNIFSASKLKVGNVVEIIPYVDATGKVQWLARVSSGGAERPAIISGGDDFEFGAILESPVSSTATKEFEAADGISFKSLLPWGLSVDVPNNFRFVGDLFGTEYYTESYPKTIFCRPKETYPVAGGFTNFEILDSNSNTATILPKNLAAELILDNFDNVNASTGSRGYFNNKIFPCSYDFNDENFHFYYPIIGV